MSIFNKINFYITFLFMFPYVCATGGTNSSLSEKRSANSYLDSNTGVINSVSEALHYIKEDSNRTLVTVESIFDSFKSFKSGTRKKIDRLNWVFVSIIVLVFTIVVSAFFIYRGVKAEGEKVLVLGSEYINNAKDIVKSKFIKGGVGIVKWVIFILILISFLFSFYMYSKKRWKKKY